MVFLALGLDAHGSRHRFLHRDAREQAALADGDMAGQHALVRIVAAVLRAEGNRCSSNTAFRHRVQVRLRHLVRESRSSRIWSRSSCRSKAAASPEDGAPAAFGPHRNVIFSAASILFVPEIVSQPDFVALVPERQVPERADTLQLIAPPFPMEGLRSARRGTSADMRVPDSTGSAESIAESIDMRSDARAAKAKRR